MVTMRYGDRGDAKPGGRIVTLWENASPGSSFSAKTVDLAGDLSVFDLVTVIYYFSTSNQHLDVVTYPARFLANNPTVPGQLQISAQTSNRTGGRNFTVPTPTSVAFSAAYYNGSNSAANTYAVPVAIYGVKL